MMARDLARMLDPVMLAMDCGIVPDPWQATLLRDQPRRSLLLCCRQAGKTTVTALIGLWVALYQAPALILLVSPSQRQSAELFRSLMQLYGKVEGAPALNAESVLKCEFANGSRILALPGSEKTIRGYAKANLIVLDEAARCDDELPAAVRPMLATAEGGGRLIALSTPAGKRGWFYQAWTGGDETWHRTMVTADQCPRISKEFLDEELRELGAQRFSEEYGLQFLDPDEAVFNTAKPPSLTMWCRYGIDRRTHHSARAGLSPAPHGVGRRCRPRAKPRPHGDCGA
jgi:Terminase large subunit, T4likevirus-type, N-terminal